MDLFDISKIIVAKIFFTKASLDDIKTTEIRDIEVYFFVGLLVFLNILQILYYQNTDLLINLIINSMIFGGFGFLLYITGQWGLGDSFLLLSLGLLNLFRSVLEAFNWVLVTFTIGIIFIFLYSFLFSVLSRKIYNFSSVSKISLIISSFFLIVSFIFLISSRLVWFLIFFLIFLYISIPFLNNVKNAMIKRVSINKLKEGDVLLNFKVWRGITKEEIENLKKKKVKYVYIKEGVRYAPTFLFVLILIIFEYFFDITFLSFFLDEDFLISVLH